MDSYLNANTNQFASLNSCFSVADLRKKYMCLYYAIHQKSNQMIKLTNSLINA